MRRAGVVALAASAALAAAPAAAGDGDARRPLEDELLGWCVGRDLWPAASEVERAAAPRACVEAAAMWAAMLLELAARDGRGREDGTRSIAAWVAACMAMNDVRAGARTGDGRCATRDRRMEEGTLPRFVPDEAGGDARSAAAVGAATRAAAETAERRLAAGAPDLAPAAEARAALAALGFACDPAPPAESMVCLFSERALGYARREPTLFASVFWSLELELDARGRVAGRRVGVAAVHP